MNPFDLQIQTTASDGKHSPRECVKMAQENGVLTIAITDHDTVAGVQEAVLAGRELGVKVIPGIEMSIQEHGMHLLGLGIDPDNEPLAAALRQAAANRLAASKQMVENFKRGGFVVDWEDVLREAGPAAIIVRPHIVSAIMKRPENKDKLEGVLTKQDFFEKYFTDAGPYYVRASTLTPGQAIELVHGALGIAVWSHPTIPDFVANCPELEKFLKELISYGLDGLEVFGPFLTEGDMTCLEKLAEGYNLVKSAGSDFHERYDPAGHPWPRSASTIGDFPTYGRPLEGVLESVEAAIAARRPHVAH